jgi:hypothetical protein
MVGSCASHAASTPPIAPGPMIAIVVMPERSPPAGRRQSNFSRPLQPPSRGILDPRTARPAPIYSDPAAFFFRRVWRTTTRPRGLYPPGQPPPWGGAWPSSPVVPLRPP